MLHHYHPNVKAVIQLLKLPEVKVSSASVNNTLQQLLATIPNLKIRIIFRTSTRAIDPSINLVKHFLAVDAEKDSARTKTVLDAWYNIEDIQYFLLE